MLKFLRKQYRDIESLIQKYKSEDKESPEWISSMEEEHEKTKPYNADMTAERAKGILDAIDNDRFLIRVKFIQEDKNGFKIVDKYEPIRESKKAGKKFVPEGRNVILTKKTNPGFWVGIDQKFLVRTIKGEKTSNYENLNVNAVVYELYQI